MQCAFPNTTTQMILNETQNLVNTYRDAITLTTEVVVMGYKLMKRLAMSVPTASP